MATKAMKAILNFKRHGKDYKPMDTITQKWIETCCKEMEYDDDRLWLKEVEHLKEYEKAYNIEVNIND